MSKFTELESGIFVSPLLKEGDFPKIAAQGIRTVVSQIPDGEVENQLSREEAEAQTSLNGLEFHFNPVMNYEVNERDVIENFGKLASSLQKPVLYYCRSGQRCTYLWAQSSVSRLGMEKTVEIAVNAGCDADALSAILEEYIEQTNSA